MKEASLKTILISSCSCFCLWVTSKSMTWHLETVQATESGTCSAQSLRSGWFFRTIWKLNLESTVFCSLSERLFKIIQMRQICLVRKNLSILKIFLPFSCLPIYILTQPKNGKKFIYQKNWPNLIELNMKRVSTLEQENIHTQTGSSLYQKLHL